MIFSFAKRGSIAPLGHFWKPSVSYSSARITDINNIYYGTSSILAFGVATGKNYILFDRIILNYEWEMTVPISLSRLIEPVLETLTLDFASRFMKLNIGVGYVF